MYIEKVPNRKSKPAYLLREGTRVGKKIQKKTLANLSHLSSEQIEALQLILKNEKLVSPERCFEIIRSLQHGHIQAVLTTIKKLGLDYLIASKYSKNKNLILGMIVSRILNPTSKLGIARWKDDTTLPIEIPEFEKANEDDFYQAMDWLITKKGQIEKKLAEQHLEKGSLVLYDLSSSYFEGECCQLAKFGYSRDKKKGLKQINYGLLTDRRGCPVAIDVFEGNVKDSATLLDQIEKIKTNFNLEQIVIVGDRGMITQGHVDHFKLMQNIDWISALRNRQIQTLFESEDMTNKIDLTKGLIEIQHPDYPGERLIVCKNEPLAKKRDYDRQSLIKKTEGALDRIQSVIKNTNLSGKDNIGLRIGRDINQFKMAKLFTLKIEDNAFTYSIDQTKLDREKNLDGIYIIRTNVVSSKMNSEEVVLGYKNLCNVERAFRSIKTMDLKIRPIYHYTDERVKAHVFLCMLAYYVEWHMKEAWRALLFSDEEIHLKETRNPVLPAKPSESAKKKAKTKKLTDGTMVHSFHSLLTHLSTLTKNKCQYKGEKEGACFLMDTKPTEKQKIAMELLESINVPRNRKA